MMTKAKKASNAFIDIMAEGAADQSKVAAPAPTKPADEPKPTAKIAPAKGRGRPRKNDAGDIQSTTIRLNADDHTALRMLALRDKVPMNDLIIKALAEYCAKRSVRFGK